MPDFRRKRGWIIFGDNLDYSTAVTNNEDERALAEHEKSVYGRVMEESFRCQEN